MIRKIVYVTLLTIFLISCATYKFTPIAVQSITIYHNRSRVIPVYKGNTLIVSVYPKYIRNDLSMQIIIKNLSSHVIAISDSDFKVYSSEDKISWTTLKTYTSEQYYKKEKNEYTAGLVLMAVGAGLSAYNAGRGRASTTGNFYGSTTEGSYYGSYNSNTTYYDPVAAELSRQQAQQNIAQYANGGKAWLDFLQKNLFYSVDLQSGQEYSGLVFSNSDYDTYYKIVLTIPNHSPISFMYIQEEE